MKATQKNITIFMAAVHKSNYRVRSYDGKLLATIKASTKNEARRVFLRDYPQYRNTAFYIKNH